jgi:hypothetical protein
MVLVWKSEGRKPFGRPRCRWEDNIYLNLNEIGWERINWIYLAQDTNKWWAYTYTVLSFRVA